MSAAFNPDDHLAEIFDAAVKLAPACTTGIDFTNYRSLPGQPSDCEKVADRSWEAGTAFVRKYHREVDAAGVRAAAEEARKARV